jgi:hypothetical protein
MYLVIIVLRQAILLRDLQRLQLFCKVDRKPVLVCGETGPKRKRIGELTVLVCSTIAGFTKHVWVARALGFCKSRVNSIAANG